MTCEAVQNRLLALPDPMSATGDVRDHCEQCERCAPFAARAVELDAELAAIVVPAYSPEVKAAFLARIRMAGPVIQSVPSPLFRSSVSLKELLSRIPVRPILAVAAAVVVSLGIWSVVPAKRLPVPEPEAMRHDLLKKVVRYNTDLAVLTGPKDKIAKLSELAVDLRNETRALSLAAQKDEMVSLAGMFDKVVQEGIVTQAGLWNPLTTTPGERQAVLNAAASELIQTANEANTLATSASMQVQPQLLRIAKTARDGHTRLTKIANGEGA